MCTGMEKGEVFSNKTKEISMFWNNKNPYNANCNKRGRTARKPLSNILGG